MASTNLEQLLLEYVNDTRLDPVGSAARYITSYSPLISSNAAIQSALNFFGVNGAALQTAFAALVSTQPLAWNDNLANAARGHNGFMIANDDQSHQEPGEPDFVARDLAAGYTGYSSLGENIYAFASSAIYAHAGFMVDWGGGTNGMQSPPGHRTNLMNSSFREIGVGITPESNGATSVGPLVITEDMGSRFGLGPLLLGVAYNDTVIADNFYSDGEGLGNLAVNVAGGGSVTSFASGGYTLETTTGAKTITFSGAGLSGNVAVTTTLAASQNVKLDIINGNMLATSASVGVSGPVSNIRGLGTLGLTISATDGTARTITGTSGGDTITAGNANDTLWGFAGNDVLNGGAGTDLLMGGAGNDTLTGASGVDTSVFAGLRSAYTITKSGLGATVTGPDGTDTISGVEFLHFDDTTIHFRPGTGTSVDFAASPSTYMGAIRDFDGVNLGGVSGWKLIGTADVDGDSRPERILVDRAIDRWATVGPAEDGLVYFDDYGWAGSTRAVGIYIDPLVEAGSVTRFGPFDSQQRFQNDLHIENIAKVLGQADYDGDGLQEIYFGLTDKTAYLHAYMHADGNIRYANYQSEQQVIDYLTAHGFASGTWSGWFT